MAEAELEAIVDDKRECCDKNQGIQSFHQVSIYIIYSMHGGAGKAKQLPSVTVQ